MIVRFTVSNFLSFKEPVEFNMLTGSPRRLEHHAYEPAEGVELLKMAAIYGANGAGKSNLVKAMLFLRDLVTRGWLSPTTFQFRLAADSADQPTSFEVEFLCEGRLYLYGVDLTSNHILEEWLYQTQQGKSDKIIFHRYTKDGKTLIETTPLFTKTDEQRLMVRLYEQDLLKPTETLLRVWGESKSDFGPVKEIFSWLDKSWTILFPHSTTNGIVWGLLTNQKFFDFAKEMMCSFHTGIVDLEVVTLGLKEFFGENSNNLREVESKFSQAEAAGENLIIKNNDLREEVLIVREDGHIRVKRLLLLHEGQQGQLTPFTIFQESDGTRRLLELVPAFFRAIFEPVPVIIDEIEQAIHPVMLRELVSKFSQNKQTKGQLIFTTHEAHLLDQEYLRQDEFWFVEKSPEGATSLTPLSDFKDVRYDLDLRKGYLLGRFGAIPFTGDLRQLNWDTYAETEQQ